MKGVVLSGMISLKRWAGRIWPIYSVWESQAGNRPVTVQGLLRPEVEITNSY